MFEKVLCYIRFDFKYLEDFWNLVIDGLYVYFFGCNIEVLFIVLIDSFYWIFICFSCKMDWNYIK